MIYGIGLSATIAGIAYFLGEFIPLGSAVLAIVIGVIISNSITIPHKFNQGIGYSEKQILAIAIALMGLGLDFSKLYQLGLETLFLIVSGIFVTIASAIFIGKLLKSDSGLSLLLGIGNGVCGASAIGATKEILKAKESDVGISIAVVNFLGTVGMFGLPFIALMLGLSQEQGGVLMGNTLQAVGQAVAGGFAYGDIAGQNATIVKMGRVVMLAFIILILIVIFQSNDNDKDHTTRNRSYFFTISKMWKNIPLFIIAFLLLSLVATLGIVPQLILDGVATLSNMLLLIAMGAIGLKISFATIKANGKVALLLGSVVFCIQIIFTLGFIFLFMNGSSI